MIGGLCVSVGLASGPYLLGAQLLAVAGVAPVAVACSYRPAVILCCNGWRRRGIRDPADVPAPAVGRPGASDKTNFRPRSGQ